MSHLLRHWLEPFYKHIPFASCLLWQSRFLTGPGARRLAITLLQQFAQEMTFTRDGFRWTIPVQDRSIGHNLFIVENWERHTLTQLVRWAERYGHLPRGSVILEIGANLGNTTLPLTTLTHCRVIAIEPVPRTLAFLKQNVTQNNLRERVTLVERAVSDHAGEIEMIVPLTALGGAEVGARGQARPEVIFQNACESARVKTTRLDALLSELALAPREVAFVWCDAQGCEGAVIRTGEPLWRAGVPLWAEIAPLLVSRQENVADFISLVKRNFATYLPRTLLEAQGAGAASLPIDTFDEFVARLTGEAQMDVLLVPPQSAA